MVEAQIQKLVEQCNEIKKTDNFCEDLVDQYLNEWKTFKNDETSIAQHHRSKRAWAWWEAAKNGIVKFFSPITNAIKNGISLFKSFCQSSDSEVNQAILELKNNQEQQKQFLNDKISLVENTLDFVIANQSKLADQIDSLYTNVQQLQNKVQKNDQNIAFLHTSSLIVARLSSLKEMQKLIIDLMRNKNNLKMSSLVLPFESFDSQLSQVYSHTDLNLPKIDRRTLYLNSIVNIRKTDEIIVFIITVPLVLGDQFALYSMQPVPFLIHNNLYEIELGSEFIVINWLRTNYAPISGIELCQQIADLYLCNVPHLETKESCEVEIFSHRTSDTCVLNKIENDVVWNRLYETGKWILAFKNALQINLLCNGKLHPFNVEPIISIAQINSQCDLQIEGQTLLHYNKKADHVIEFTLATADLSWIDNQDLDESAIHKKTLGDIKQSMGIPLYIIIILICLSAVGLAITGIVIFICYRRRVNKNAAASTSTTNKVSEMPHQNDFITMSNFGSSPRAFKRDLLAIDHLKPLISFDGQSSWEIKKQFFSQANHSTQSHSSYSTVQQ